MPAQLPPPDRRRYAPLTPSPLNPNTYLNVTKIRQQQQQQSTLGAKPPNGNPSSLPQQYAALAHANPTERLVRQKAAAAWRCETLRHYVLLRPRPGSEHTLNNHHHLIDFAVNPPPAPINNHNHNHNHNYNNHPSSSNNQKYNNKTPPSPEHGPSRIPTPQANHAWAAPPPTHHYHHQTPPPTPYADHADPADDDISGDIGLGINPGGYRDNDSGSSFPLTSPLLSPTLLLLGGSGSGTSSGSGSSGSGSGGMVLPFHAGSSSVKQRAGRRRVGAGKGGGGGGGVVGVRRVLVVVALFLGMGLVHGLVSAFGSGGGRGGGGGGNEGGRPPPPAER